MAPRYPDPKREIEEMLRHYPNDGYFGPDPIIPIASSLLRDVVRRRECGSRTVSTYDEDGPMPPMELMCHLLAGHDVIEGTNEHYNGYCHWTGADESLEAWRMKRVLLALAPLVEDQDTEFMLLHLAKGDLDYVERALAVGEGED